jgi:UDP-glucose 4-epimerase
MRALVESGDEAMVADDLRQRDPVAPTAAASPPSRETGWGPKHSSLEEMMHTAGMAGGAARGYPARRAA